MNKSFVATVSALLVLLTGGLTAEALPGPAGERSLERTLTPVRSEAAAAVPAAPVPVPIPAAPGPVPVPGIPGGPELADVAGVAQQADAPADAVPPGPGDPEPAPAGPAEEAAATADGALRPPLADLAPGEFAGYATGTVIHADALQHAGQRLVNLDLAFSGVTFSSEALGEQLNELRHVVAPGLEADTGVGRGNGLELDLAQSLPIRGLEDDDGLDLRDEVQADAPPDSGLLSEELLDLDVAPIVRARILRAQARAEQAASGCVLGTDLAHGLGYVADIDLLDLSAEGEANFTKALLSTSAEDPERVVSQSLSETFLVPSENGGPPFALMSETRQTVAPVTLFKGTEHEVTIELLGEWVLRALVDGTDSTIHYGPETDSPETPVLRINKGDDVAHEITLQQFLGEYGRIVEIPGLLEIAIGEDPRAIGGDENSHPVLAPTEASAGVDVVRVRLLHDSPLGASAHVADLRIGHMEVAAAVPEGGIDCPGIGMAKGADPATVEPGQSFTWTVTVSNPNDCILTDLDVVDTISTTPGVVYSVVSTDPPAASVRSTEVVWNDIGPLGVGQSEQLQITVAVADDSQEGTFTDRAVATGVCGPAGDEAEAGVDVPVVSFENDVTVDSPTVEESVVVVPAGPDARPAAPAAPETPTEVLGAAEERPRAAPAGTLPRTGGLLGLLSGLALLATGRLLRRLRPRS